MIDETTDVSNQEQITIVMRRINEDLEVYEGFLGLYQVAPVIADSLVAVIKDVMTRINLWVIFVDSVMTGVVQWVEPEVVQQRG